MALKGTHNNENTGASFGDAYAKVASVHIDDVEKSARAVVNIYVDQTARSAKKVPVEQKAYTYVNTPATVDADGKEVPANNAYDDTFGDAEQDKENNNPIKSVYAHIKTLDEWDGWIDA